jgi:hypothetical protein
LVSGFHGREHVGESSQKGSIVASHFNQVANKFLNLSFLINTLAFLLLQGIVPFEKAYKAMAIRRAQYVCENSVKEGLLLKHRLNLRVVNELGICTAQIRLHRSGVHFPQGVVGVIGFYNGDTQCPLQDEVLFVDALVELYA